MTRQEQAEKIREADDMLSQAHSLLVDVRHDRHEVGAGIQGDVIDTSIRHVTIAIDSLRDCGESPDYMAAWER